jgi:hypothetical protein
MRRRRRTRHCIAVRNGRGMGLTFNKRSLFAKTGKQEKSIKKNQL